MTQLPEHTDSPPISQTPLYPLCLAQNARMTEFAGWEMPVQFSGITKEHEAVRTQAGMFDISHMGKFRFTGAQVVEQLQTLVPSDLSRLQPGQAQYTVLLNPEGGILDDIIYYHQGQDPNTGEQRGTMIVNAATRVRDKAWLVANLNSDLIVLEDVSKEQALIAIQGPQAERYFQPDVEANLSSLKRFEHLESTVFGQPAFIARTGYTGEDGFEVMLPPAAAIELWQKLSDAGVTPCGLGARDTLRLEAAMALYGQDIEQNVTPLEAGLGWLVHLDSKGDFMGRPILEQQKAEGIPTRLVGLQMQGRYIARHGYPVMLEGNMVGEVTSGTLSPTLGYPIALAYVPTHLAKVGQQLGVEIRGKVHSAEVVKKPFYKANTQ
ncbi:glycine cleavage system aminomethyltransferase GcvT [Oscillatoria laete-virens NRMC-F 0139]|nr:glycine cleavage system aminomethyltransferase GcvT [Oscillatoria laete-virens NRMC-F 0139]